MNKIYKISAEGFTWNDLMSITIVAESFEDAIRMAMDDCKISYTPASLEHDSSIRHFKIKENSNGEITGMFSDNIAFNEFNDEEIEGSDKFTIEEFNQEKLNKMNGEIINEDYQSA